MDTNKANHICKNINCKKGKDGGRAHYFACDYCSKTLNWRSMACSKECYIEYMEQIEVARHSHNPIDTYPERTDMSHEEIVELVTETPVEIVKERTNEQLLGYEDIVQESGFSAAVDMINSDMKKRKRK